MTEQREKIRPSSYAPDMPGEQLGRDVLTGLANMVPDDGFYQQAQPYRSAFGTLLYAPRYLIPNQDEDSAYWLYAGDAAVGVTDGASHWPITPAGGLTNVAALTSPWSGGVVNQLPVLNSKVDGPYWWDQETANVMTALPDWPAGDLCNTMRPFREFLIAMNIFTGGARIPDLLRWSDAAAPGDIPRSWTAGSDTQAGERSVSFNPGALVDGRQLRDRFYIYKTSSVYLLQLIGGQFVFSSRPVFASFGALAPNCIEEWRGRHIVLTDGDLVVHDGSTVSSLADEQTRKAIFDDLDGTNFENSYVVLRRDLNELWVCRPRVGETYPSEAWVLDLQRNKWGRRDLVNSAGTPHATEGIVEVQASGIERTWAEKTTQWNNDPTRWSEAAFQRTANFVVLADYGSDELHQVGEGNDYAGDPIVTELRRDGLDLGNDARKKYPVRIWPQIEGTPGGVVQLEVGCHDTPDTEPTWSAPRDFVIGQDRFVEFDEENLEGYFVSWRARTTSQLPWRMPQLTVQFEWTGAF